MTPRSSLVALFVAASLVASPAAAQRRRPPPVAAAASPAQTLAQSLTGAAKSDYEAGKVLASDGDFAGALIKFRAAYDGSKDARLLWNVAFCEKNLRHYAKVITTLRRYLAEGGALLSEKDKKDAQDLITTIEPFTTKMTIHVSEDGAQIFVDDDLAGTSPLAAPVVLDIGERHIKVTKDGFTPFEKTTPVGGSAALSLDVTLAKVVHQGRLVVNAPEGATIFVDDAAVGVGKVDRVVPAGGHQLRVTAPSMRPYQSEIVVQDNETRSVDVVLEREALPEMPKIRVAVGCGDSEPRAPEEGLVVYLDGPDVVAPTNVKKRWNDALGRNVVDYVEYPVTVGPHRVRVRSSGCDSLETAVVVDAVKGADVTGALQSDTFILFRGPQGSPGHFRVGAGVVFANGDASDTVPEEYKGSLLGGTLDAGFYWRWFDLSLEGERAGGSIARQTFNTNYALPSSAKTTLSQLLLRAGFRIPLHTAALAFGPEFGIQELDVDAVRTGKATPAIGAWASVDVEPLCDWGVSVLESFVKPTDNDSPTFSLGVRAFFQPNGVCRRERATQFGLR